MTHEDLVARHERVTSGGIPYVHLRQEDAADRRLVVTYATHNNGDRYASLTGRIGRLRCDILGLRDPGNGYYLGRDGGAEVGLLLRDVAAAYDPSGIPLFGSSMVGYAALRWALELDANCLVNNPQVNLDATIPLAWEPLRGNISRIPVRVNLDEQDYGPRRCVLRVLHGRHPMDQENIRRLWALWLRTPGMRLDIEQAGEAQHGYLIGDFARYATLVEEVFAARAARGAG